LKSVFLTGSDQLPELAECPCLRRVIRISSQAQRRSTAELQVHGIYSLHKNGYNNIFARRRSLTEPKSWPKVRTAWRLSIKIRWRSRRPSPG